MAKNYAVSDWAIKMTNNLHAGIMEIDGVDAVTAWPKALRLARRKDWALDALLKHAVTGRCGGNADLALDNLWARLGNDAYGAYLAEIAANKFDRHGNEREVVATIASDTPMLLHLGRFGL